MARIFHLDSPSPLCRRLCSASRSASLSRLFQHRPAVAFTRFLQRIMHLVAFPFVSTSTAPRLPFLFSTGLGFLLSLIRRSFRSFHLSQCTHFFDASSSHLYRFPIALPVFSTCTSYFQTESLFFYFSVYFNVERRCPLRTAMTWIRPYRSILYDAITSFAVLPYSDSEPAASGSFSFSRSSKMLSSR